MGGAEVQNFSLNVRNVLLAQPIDATHALKRSAGMQPGWPARFFLVGIFFRVLN